VGCGFAVLTCGKAWLSGLRFQLFVPAPFVAATPRTIGVKPMAGGASSIKEKSVSRVAVVSIVSFHTGRLESSGLSVFRSVPLIGSITVIRGKLQ
jgi:hypothetical protein